MPGEGVKLRRAALMLGVAGGGLGIAFALFAIGTGAVEADAHPADIGFGLSALIAAIVGLLCTWWYANTSRLPAALALVGAAAWHIVSTPIYGIVGGVVMLIAGLCAALALEGGAALSRERPRPLDTSRD